MRVMVRSESRAWLIDSVTETWEVVPDSATVAAGVAPTAVTSGIDWGSAGAPAVGRGEPGDGAPVVAGGEGAGRHRRGEAGAADLDPPAAGAEVVGIVDGDAGVRVGEPGDVGRRALRAALGDDAVLVGRLPLLRADATPAAGPGGFGAVRAAVECQGGAADGDDVGRI